AFWNQRAHAFAEAAQRDFAGGQRADSITARGHAVLHALDQYLVLGVDLAVDAPVAVARHAHFAARVRVRIADLADQAGGRGDRQPLHDVDLVGIDVEREVRPELEV